ncbi:MAG: hypothetical protein IJ713_01180 [Oscillibacter sp.]|nr:hypothetical protein [Oscillibacter sp.]
MIDLIARYAGYMTGIFSALVLFVKPVREWLFGQKAEREAIRCLLRAEMLSTYYKDKDAEKIRQYDKENFVLSYKAYKALKGNSFIDDINETVKKWEVIT